MLAATQSPPESFQGCSLFGDGVVSTVSSVDFSNSNHHTPPHTPPACFSSTRDSVPGMTAAEPPRPFDNHVREPSPALSSLESECSESVEDTSIKTQVKYDLRPTKSDKGQCFTTTWFDKDERYLK